jgi:hypothetical protein
LPVAAAKQRIDCKLTIRMLRLPRVQLPLYLADDWHLVADAVTVHYVLQMLQRCSRYPVLTAVSLVVSSFSSSSSALLSLSVAEPIDWNNLLASSRPTDIDF